MAAIIIRAQVAAGGHSTVDGAGELFISSFQSIDPGEPTYS
jgi:hypothetical protein